MSDWRGEYCNRQTLQSIVKMREGGIPGLSRQAIWADREPPRQGDRFRRKIDVTEGSMMMASDMRPKATLLIGLSQYALQHQTCIQYELKCQVLHLHCIGWSPIESMMQGNWPLKCGIDF
jgi:hypothetical protein